MEARERYLEGQAIQEAREEGYKTGIREVVEWLQALVVGEKLLSGEIGQAKLKEWGIP